MHRLQEIDDRNGGTPSRHFIVRMTVGTSSRQMMKPLCIIAAAMALVVASSAAMAVPKKQSSDRATHRMKSPQSVPAPLRKWPPDNPTPREYEELKREGWYKADKA